MSKSLQSEFVKYYKDKLEPLGFRKVKGRQPYFVRVVNDEILHIFTFVGAKSTIRGYKAFHLRCGIATVYRKEINFSVPPSHNGDWLIPYGKVNEVKDTEYPVLKNPRDSKIFYYNDENIDEVLALTLEGCKVIIKELNKVSNMDQALEYFMKYNPGNIIFKTLLNDKLSDEEGGYYVRKEFDYSKMHKIFENKKRDLKNSDRSENYKDEHLRGLIEWEERVKKAREEFINNEDDYEKGISLLTEHYSMNVDKIVKYGLDIKKREIIF